MKKMNHKAIKELGNNLNGIYLNVNIYTFENAEHYISRLSNFSEVSGVCCHKVNEIIDGIKKEIPSAKGCRVDSLYYASGLYGCIGRLSKGCIGRLSKVTVLDSDWEPTEKQFYIYF